jgi:hypothetical protein
MKRGISRLILIGVALIVIVCLSFAIAVHYLKSLTSRFPSNSILVIQPYKYNGLWVFDDSRTGLVREPFVAGIPGMIDKLVDNIPDANSGFRLIFSSIPFPGYQEKLIWRRAEGPGDWYYSKSYDMEGWLCPALSKYFRKAPAEIYVKAEPKH